MPDYKEFGSCVLSVSVCLLVLRNWTDLRVLIGVYKVHGCLKLTVWMDRE